MIDTIVTWQIIEPPTFDAAAMKIDPGMVELAEIPSPELTPGQVLVEVAGCAICCTDASNIDDTAATGTQSPRPLSYEISGTVTAGDEAWLGKEVVIPASVPCGRCDFCVTGQGHCCDNPKEPMDNTPLCSSFSSHVTVSSSDLFAITHRVGIPPLEHFAGVFDELATPFQASRCASLGQGDLVMVIGGKAMGQYLVQIAKVSGAKTIIAVDSIPSSHWMMDKVGDLIVSATAKDPEEITTEIKTYIEKEQLPKTGWKIFTAGGLKPNLQTTRDFLGYADKLIVLGCSNTQVQDIMKKIGASSDVEIMGVCGGPPEVYPQILQMVTSGKVQISHGILTRPMSWIREAFEEMNDLEKDKRIILTTDDFGLDYCPEAKSCR